MTHYQILKIQNKDRQIIKSVKHTEMILDNQLVLSLKTCEMLEEAQYLKLIRNQVFFHSQFYKINDFLYPLYNTIAEGPGVAREKKQKI